jgi:N-acetylneuraminate synthase
MGSFEFLKQYNCLYNKIASAMITNLEFCQAVAKEKKMTFISTGMCTLFDVDKVVEMFRTVNCPFVLMHCVSTYPCDDSECNLLMIKTLQQRYGCHVGYSGHERGLLPSILAVSLGATVVERHITEDRTDYGSDQAASLERKGMELLVRDCNDVYTIFGHGVKHISEKEKEIARKLRYWSA